MTKTAKKHKYPKTTRKVIVEKTVKNIDGLFKFTKKFQHSVKCKDGKRRSYYLFFLNNVLILKQKHPFDETAERGCDGKIYMKNVYLLGGKIHQERSVDYNDQNPRLVKYPISKEKLAVLNVPSDLKIELSK